MLLRIAVLISILSSQMTWAQSKNTTLVRVTSDNTPGQLYKLELGLDKLGSLIEIIYSKNGKVVRRFTPHEAKSGVTLMRESGVPIITLTAAKSFSAQTGGSVEYRVMRTGGLFSGFHYRDLNLLLEKGPSGWVLYTDLPSGKKRFNEIFMEAFRKNDPEPESRSLGTGNPNEAAIGIKNISFSLDGQWVDSVNTAELK